MKIPSLKVQEITDEIVSFVNEDNSIQGQAFKRQGEEESHYTIIQIKEYDGLKEMRMVRTGAVGSFQVIGQISFLFDDGMPVLNCKGFEFWLENEELATWKVCSPKLGNWLEIEIKDFELYI